MSSERGPIREFLWWVFLLFVVVPILIILGEMSDEEFEKLRENYATLRDDIRWARWNARVYWRYLTDG